MRGINYLVGLGTLLVFAGYYCIKAVFPKKLTREGVPFKSAPMSPSLKLILILLGSIFILLGIYLILKATKLI